MEKRPYITSPAVSWIFIIFIFSVFALSSWTIPRQRDGYDAASADELSETAETGSVGRQIALTCLGLYSFGMVCFRRGYKVQLNGIVGAMLLAYIAWATASIMWSTDTELTIKAVVRLLLMWLGAFAIAKQLTIYKIAYMTFYVSVLTVLVSVATELVLGTFDPINTSWRLSGIMHPVSQGWNCGLLSISAMYLSSRSSHRRGYQSAMVMGLVCLALTKSRMAFAATLVIMGLYYLWNSTPVQRIGAVMAFSGIMGLVLLVTGSNVQHYAAFGRAKETEATFDTLTGRIPLWQECIRYSRKRPLFGYGYNAFLSPSNLLGISDASGWMSSPHSGYIGTLYELGIIGFGLLVATLVLAMRLAFGNASRNEDQLFVGCVLGWIAINLLLETFLITSCFFATFLAFSLLAKVSFTSDVYGRCDPSDVPEA